MTASGPQQPASDATETPEPQTLMEAILRVQGELPKVSKSGTNPHFNSKFVTLDALMEAVLPILNKNGLVWLAVPGFTEHEGRYEAILNYGLYHVSTDQSVKGHMLLLAAKDDPQGQGAAITYARRYALTAVLGITADTDDDGNTASQSRRDSQQRAQEARTAAQPLSDEQRDKMLIAVREAGLDVAETMEKAGIDIDGPVTVAQGRQVRAMIEAAKPVEGES